MKKILAVLPLMIAPSLCFADGWTAPLTVTQAFTENSDLIVIYVSNSTAYGSGCDPGSWIFNGSTDARRGRVWATILTALTTGQKVKFWNYDTCSTWNYSNVGSVMLVGQ